MALNLTPEQKALGKTQFEEAVGRQALTRRDFMKGLLAASTVVPISAGVYFGYQAWKGKPVRTGLIGTGDEGGVLAGTHNPEYLEFIAASDIRPSNQKRIFEGEPNPPRVGFNAIYGKKAASKIQFYTDYKELLANPEIEAVVIALPLHLHAPVAIDAMKAGKHVLCEKLMAWSVPQCKDMIQVAEETNRVLTIGHQRHYSLLYAHAVELLNAGELGEVRHIRALWHRNNTWPLLDANGQPVLDERGKPMLRDGWRPLIKKEDREALQSKLKQLQYKSMEELVRWRLFNRTGGGLMVELGSHQLDACSIFLGKVHPLAVQGVGGKFFYKDEREANDHIFLTFEFPGKDYFERGPDGQPTRTVKDRDDIVVATYSSISTNSFEKYGECVMGNRGTMIVEEEQSIMLFPARDPNKKDEGKATGLTVTTAGGRKPASDSSSTTGAVDPVKAQATGAAALSGAVSRGYREEMEHFAVCIRLLQEAEKQKASKEEREKLRLAPRCHGKVAMADAIIALTSNLAMKNRQRIEFKEEWFDPKSPQVPDADVKAEVV